MKHIGWWVQERIHKESDREKKKYSEQGSGSLNYSDFLGNLVPNHVYSVFSIFVCVTGAINNLNIMAE